MRCLYCDRGLGILGFRNTEPFCSFEHRKLHYRRADPPLAKLLSENPHLSGQPAAPVKQTWIPAVTQQVPREALPSQTLRDPTVSSTGPVTPPIRAVTEVESPKGRPAPVEFSSVVYVIPPGDGELTAADIRERILKTSDFTGTLRVTLTGSPKSRGPRLMYGPELHAPEASRPISVSVCHEIETIKPPCRADFAELTAGPRPDSIGPAISTGPIDRAPILRFPEENKRRTELRRGFQFHGQALQRDVEMAVKIMPLDPIPFSGLFLFTLGSGRRIRGSQLKSDGQFHSIGWGIACPAISAHLVTIKDFTTRKARSASIFAPVLPSPRAKPASTENT
jgi:hypothetical protein